MKAAKQVRNWLLGLAACALCGAPAIAQQSNPASTGYNSKAGSLTTSDRQFVKAAAEGGMAEVELGKLAEENGGTSEVKDFGKRMVTDHTKINDQLKELAGKEDVTLPQQLNAKDKMTKESLSKLSGTAFDKAYMKDMVKDHTADVSEFRKESTAAHSAAVKDFASDALPTLESHLKEAKSIAPKATTAMNMK